MTVKITGNPVASNPDEDSVVILGADGNYYSLSGAGRFVWDRLVEGPRAAEALAAGIVAAFDVELEQARSDLAELLDQLRSAKLIEVVPS